MSRCRLAALIIFIGAGSSINLVGGSRGIIRSEPSNADRRLTQPLKDVLSLLDIRTLDHFVIGGADATSFAERGLL